MLILSRQRDEAIIVGDRIRAVVVDVRGDKVRLGIDAPREYAVYRKELYDGMVGAIERGGLPPRPRRKDAGHGMLVLARKRDEALVLCLALDYPEARPSPADPAALRLYEETVARAAASFLEVAAQFTVVDVRGDKVRIGTSAPEDVPVHRQEVYDRIRREERDAVRRDAARRPPAGNG